MIVTDHNLCWIKMFHNHIIHKRFRCDPGKYYRKRYHRHHIHTQFFQQGLFLIKGHQQGYLIFFVQDIPRVWIKRDHRCLTTLSFRDSGQRLDNVLVASVQAIKRTDGDHTASAILHIIYLFEYLQLLINSSIVIASVIW